MNQQGPVGKASGPRFPCRMALLIFLAALQNGDEYDEVAGR